jgi:hypothetical protein
VDMLPPPERSFVPSAYDIVFENAELSLKTQIVYLRRGPDLLIVMIPRVTQAENGILERPFDVNHSLEHTHAYEACQSVLSTLPFGKTDCVYLSKDHSGAWRCIPRRIPSRQLFEPWGYYPMVDDTELQYTRLVRPNLHEAIWNGMEVDVARPSSFTSLHVLMMEQLVESYRRMGDLPYKFEILAFLKHNDVVRGIIMEPCRGRPVRLTDRALIYRTWAELERHGLLFARVDGSDIVIGQDGLPKITDLFHRVFEIDPDPVIAEEVLREVHWGPLREMFNRLESHRGYIYDHKFVGCSRFELENSNLMVPISSPTMSWPAWARLPENPYPDDVDALLAGIAQLRIDAAASTRPKDKKAGRGKKLLAIGGSASNTSDQAAPSRRRRIRGGDRSADTANEADLHSDEPARVIAASGRDSYSTGSLGAVLST